MIWIGNVRIISDGRMRMGNVLSDGGKILEAGDCLPPEGAEKIDGKGRYLTPGLIDLHLHGGGGCSALTDNTEDIARMARAHARFGTTAILPTVMAAPMEQMMLATDAIRRTKTPEDGAQILGVHLEGPCLSPVQSGAQAPGALQIPSQCDMDRLIGIWREGVKMVGAAPELDGGLELGERLAKQGIVMSIAHSNATYDQAQQAMEYGYSDVTHLYSCCSAMIRVNGYRVPGVIEAGLNLDGLMCQVIADGKHLPLSLLSLIYRCKGEDGMYLVSDALEFAAAQVEEGTEYRQKNGMVTVYEDGVMKLPDRKAFAGSVATMNRLVRVAVQAGIPVEKAVKMASENPARRLGLQSKGAIRPGMDADLVLFSEAFEPETVMIGGRILPDAQKTGKI